MGMQFYDVAVYAVGAGGVCLAVYRGLQGESFGAIWAFTPAPQSTAAEVILGAVVGIIAGAVGLGFRRYDAKRTNNFDNNTVVVRYHVQRNAIYCTSKGPWRKN